jgi:hypothetical protein
MTAGPAVEPADARNGVAAFDLGEARLARLARAAPHRNRARRGVQALGGRAAPSRAGAC